jgi:sugar phosphate isomerase/epimerase
MNLAMTSDYFSSRGDPSPYLHSIAAAGFTHVHWCHEWNTDYLYSAQEITEIAGLLSSLNLRLLDLHASHGLERSWGALDEELRIAGVELVENRIIMAASLSSRVIILHVPEQPPGSIRRTRFWDALFRSLDELEPVAARHGVRIAIENMPGDDFSDIRRLFARYGPDFLGLCYDSGHGNIGGTGLDHLEQHRDRLISVHLHDNDGVFDLHNLPFTGTVDWPKLAQNLRASSYRGCVSLESNMRGLAVDADVFLADALTAATRLALLVAGSTSNTPAH